MRVGLVAAELWNLQDIACSGAGSGRAGGKPNSAAMAAASGSSQRIQSLRWYSRRVGVPMISSVRRLKSFEGLAMNGPRPDMNSRNAANTETPSARSRTAVRGWRLPEPEQFEPGASGAQAGDTAGPLRQPANV
jgi:hypothetical protein